MSERRVSVAKVEKVRGTFARIERKVTLKDAVRELYPDIKEILESGTVTAHSVHEHLKNELGASAETIKSYIQDIRKEEEEAGHGSGSK
jgi:hypothetical protein